MIKYHIDERGHIRSDDGQPELSDEQVCFRLEQYALLTGPNPPVKKDGFEAVFGHIGTPAEAAEQWMNYQSKAEKSEKLETENGQLRQLLNEFMQIVMTDPKFADLMSKLAKKQPAPH